MSFVSTLKLASVWEAEDDAVFILLVMLSSSLFAAWSWGTEVNCPDGSSIASLWASTDVLGSLKCVVNPRASASILNAGLTVWECFTGSVTSLSCTKVSVFWDGTVAVGTVALPAKTFVSVTRFCKELEAMNVFDILTDSHSFSKQFFLPLSSEPPASHPTRGDTTLLLFFCECVFTLRHEPELIPQACFFALSIPKRHFSLRFLHIQSCNLQYKRLLARLVRWETPLIEDMNPFFLMRCFALRWWLCVRCIW